MSRAYLMGQSPSQGGGGGRSEQVWPLVTVFEQSVGVFLLIRSDLKGKGTWDGPERTRCLWCDMLRPVLREFVSLEPFGLIEIIVSRTRFR